MLSKRLTATLADNQLRHVHQLAYTKMCTRALCVEMRCAESGNFIPGCHCNYDVCTVSGSNTVYRLRRLIMQIGVVIFYRVALLQNAVHAKSLLRIASKLPGISSIFSLPHHLTWLKFTAMKKLWFLINVIKVARNAHASHRCSDCN